MINILTSKINISLKIGVIIGFLSLCLVTNFIYGQNDLTAIIGDATQEAQCHNGSIDLTVNGGFEPYEFVWSTSTGFPPGYLNEDLNNLNPGNYCVTVTDAMCGTATACFQVDCCPAIPAAFTQTYCGDPGEGYLGNIHLNWPLIWPLPYTVYWYNSQGEFVRTGQLSGVPLDTYTAHFVAEDGICSTTRTYTFGIEPLKVSLDEIGHITHCPLSSDGHARLSITGGQSPYNVTWSGPGGFNAFGNRIALIGVSGIYTATIVDNNGCSINLDVEICCCAGTGNCNVGNQPLNIEHNVVSPSMGNNGSIDLTVTGGSGDYIFVWDNGGRTEDINNLGPGQYCVEINDGCDVEELCFTLRDCQSFPVVIDAEIDHSCLSWENRGSINLTVIEGESPFTYEWNNGITENTPNLTDLSPGEYCVTVTDKQGCFAVGCYYLDDISNSSPPTVEGVIIPARDGQGGIILNASGEENYNFSWSNGRTTENIYNLTGGEYTVTITNSIGCSQVNSYVFTPAPCETEPPPTLSVESGDDEYPTLSYKDWCNEDGGMTPIKLLELSGGFPPYTLKIESEIAPGDGDYTLEQTLYYESEQNDINLGQFSRKRYRITASDLCTSSEPELLDLCTHCGFYYNIDNEVIYLYDYIDEVEEGVLLKLKCTCEEGDCEFSAPRIKVEVRNIVPMNYTIDWPNGPDSHFGPESQWPNDIVYHLSGDERSGTPFHVIIIREDGCTLDLEFRWSDDQQENVIMHDLGFGIGGPGFVLSNGNIIDDYYFGNYTCTFCNPLQQGGLYIEDPYLCDAGNESNVVFFELTLPSNIPPGSSICSNGGTITAYHLDNDGNAHYDSEFEIPITTNYQEITTDWVGKISTTTVCTDGGGCIFPSEVIFDGVSMSKDILVTYCAPGASYELPDQDGDDIPDEYDPCPTIYGILCDDPEELETDCIVDEWAGVDCNYIVTCNGVTEAVEGTYMFAIFNNYSSEFDCHYCFSVEYCELITSTGELLIEFQSDPQSHLIVISELDDDCYDPNNPNACSSAFFCDANLNGIAEEDEFFAFTCIAECSTIEYVENYVTECSPVLYHEIITSQTLTNDGDSIITKATINWDKEYLRNYIHDQRINEISKLKDQNFPSFRVYPNPTTNYTVFETKLSSGIKGIIQIYNILGETIYRKSVKLDNGYTQELINLEYLSSGIYFFKFFDLEGKELYSNKIIKL